MNILVLAPHPDDDAIGCGGTIRRHVLEGHSVHVIYLSDGEKGMPGTSENHTREIRRTEAGVCSQILGTEELYFWHMTDGHVAAEQERAVKSLIQKLIDVQYGIVYCPHKLDEHPDHRAAYEIAYYARHQLVLHDIPDIRPEFRTYEVWTPMADVKQVIDISGLASSKRGAIRCHKSQLSNAFDEAILALNHYRGLLLGPNWMYAEAFGVIE